MQDVRILHSADSSDLRLCVHKRLNVRFPFCVARIIFENHDFGRAKGEFQSLLRMAKCSIGGKQRPIAHVAGIRCGQFLESWMPENGQKNTREAFLHRDNPRTDSPYWHLRNSRHGKWHSNRTSFRHTYWFTQGRCERYHEWSIRNCLSGTPVPSQPIRLREKRIPIAGVLAGPARILTRLSA